MFYFLMGALVLLLSAGLYESKEYQRMKRLVDSEECDISEYPYMVSLFGSNRTYSYENYHQFTSYTGVLLSKKYILTDQDSFSYGTDYLAIAGTNYNTPTDKCSLSNYSDHFDYNSGIYEGAYSKKDYLRIVKVDPPFKTSAKIKPVTLPSERGYLDTDSCKTVTIVGWGAVTDDQGDEESVTVVPGHVGSKLKCSSATLRRCKDSSDRQDTTVFCFILDDEDKTLCGADKGLAVMCEDILVGLTHGFTGYGCEQNRRGRATNISHFANWIEDKTKVDIAFEAEPNRKYTLPKTTKKQPVFKLESCGSRLNGANCAIWSIVVILLTKLMM